MIKTIHIIAGPPCSGKTSYFNSFNSIYNTDVVQISADSLFQSIFNETHDVVRFFPLAWMDYVYRTITSAAAADSYVLDGLSDQDVLNGDPSIFVFKSSISNFIALIKDRYYAEHQQECPYTFVVHWISINKKSTQTIFKNKNKTRRLGYVIMNYSNTPSLSSLKADHLIKIRAILKSSNEISYQIPEDSFGIVQFQTIANNYYKKCITFGEHLINTINNTKTAKPPIIFCISPSPKLEKAIRRGLSNKSIKIYRSISKINSNEKGFLLTTDISEKDAAKTLQNIHHFLADSSKSINDFSFIVLNLIPDERTQFYFDIPHYKESEINRKKLGFGGLDIKILNINFIFDTINSLN